MSDPAYHVLQLILRREYIERAVAKAGSASIWQERESQAIKWVVDQLGRFGYGEEIAEAEDEARAINERREERSYR